MYKANVIKNGKLLTEEANAVFENNTKDLNFISFMISDFRKKHPDYIAKIEQFYGKNIDSILKKFKDSKEDLRRVENGFSKMIDSINNFNRRGPQLVVPKTKSNILPKFRPEVLEILKNGSLDDKIEILLAFIDEREKDNKNNISEVSKFWDNHSSESKKFEYDINSLREDSIMFIRKGLLAISTKKEQPGDC